MARRSTQRMPGWAGKTAERERFIELYRQGASISEACRIVGVNRKTGTRWVHGRRDVDRSTGRMKVYAPIVRVAAVPAAAAGVPWFLSEEERVTIADLHRAGERIRAIAARLGRAPSTISRELRRNTLANGEYRPFRAQELARRRRARPRPSKIALNPTLHGEIQAMMLKRWSPGQIARQLRVAYPDDATMRVVHETIYRDLYDWRGSILRREFCQLLRTKRTSRKHSRLIPRRRSRFASGLSITDRPFAPTDRSVPGAWEGDLIMGRGNKSAIATLVERTTRFTMLLPVNAPTRADSLRDQLIPAFMTLPPDLRRSITWDQGWEMARHEETTAATGADIYFCDAHSPWQRGTNESTNRLLRDYFPKRTDLSIHKPQKLAAVALELNQRPRKVLGWATPHELFSNLLKTTNQIPLLQ